MAVNKRKIQANAQKYLQKGQLDKALKEYERLVQADPRDSNSRLKVGDVKLRMGDKEGSIEAYQKVAEQFMKDGFDAKAVALYKQIGKIDPQRVDIHEPLAELYQRLGLTAEALQALQTAADVYHREGRKRDALELLRKMATLDPTNTTSRLKIADLLRQADMPEDALAEYEAVAEELARQGAREELLGVYERILELEPERTAALVELSRILVEQGQGERAEPFVRKLVELQPELPDGHEMLAEIHTRAGREDAATEAYRTLADVYRRVGDDDKAREITQRIFGSDLVGDAGLGGTASDLDDLPAEPAAAGADPDVLEQALDMESTQQGVAFSADAEQMLAEASVYLRYGKTDRAIATLEALLATEPDHRSALEKLGEAHVEKGDRAKAVQVWSRAAQVAQAEDDEQGFAVLRERIAQLDASAAEGLASGGPDAPAAVPAPPAADEDRTAAAEEDRNATSLDDVDLEIDLGDESLDEELGADAAGDDAAADLEVDLGDPGDDATPAGAAEKTVLQMDPSELAADTPPPAAADAAPAQPEAPAAGASASGSQGASASSAAEVRERLEEAEFYFEQGMHDEARAAYEAILELAPSHPQAQLRLGELAEKTGGDAGAGEAAPAEGAAAEDLGDELIEWDLDEAGAGPDDAGADTSGAEETPAAAAAGEDEIEVDLDTDLEVELGDLSGEEEISAGGEASGVEPSAPGDAAEEVTSPAAAREQSDTQPDLGEESVEIDDAAFDLEGLDASGEDTATDLTPHAEGAAAGVEEEALADDATPVSLDVDVEADTERAAASEAAEEDESEPAFEAADEEESEPASEAEEDESQPAFEAAEEDESEPAFEAAEEDESEATFEPAGEEGAAEEDDATFDLAAELSDVLEDDAPAAAEEADDGFEAVFREFKKGVREQLSEGDYEAHYELGIAYREMGLLDDAAGEFRIAVDSPELKLASLHMLGVCALDQDAPADATGWFERALALPSIPEEQQAALRFDLGRAYEAAGDAARARAAYAAVAAVDPDYQDVSERLEALSDEGAASQVESFESFDDLIAEAESALGGEAEAEEAPPAEEDAPFDPTRLVAEVEEEDDEDAEPALPEDEPAGPAAALDAEPAEDLDAGPPEALDADAAEAGLEPEAEPVLEAVVEEEPEAEATVEAEVTQPPDGDDGPDGPEPPAPGGGRRRKKKISFL